MRELLATEHDSPITDLEIRRATLEDAYLSIVEQFESGSDLNTETFEGAQP